MSQPSCSIVHVQPGSTHEKPHRLLPHTINRSSNKPTVYPDTHGLLFVICQGKNSAPSNGISLSLPSINTEYIPTHTRLCSNPNFLYATFNSTGDEFCIADQSNKIYLFSMVQNRYFLFASTPSTCTALLWNHISDSELYVALSDCSLRVYSIADAKFVAQLGRKDKITIQSLSLHPSGCYLLATTSQFCTVWDLRTYSKVRSLSGGEGVGLKTAFYIPISTLIFTCFRDDSIHTWHSLSFEHQYKIQLPPLIQDASRNPKLRYIAVSRDGKLLAGAGRDPYLYIWKLENQQLIKLLELPTKHGISAVKSMEFLARNFDGGSSSFLVLLGQDGRLRVINIITSEIVTELFFRDPIGNENCYENILRFVLSPDGVYCLCIMESGIVRIYDMETILEKKKIVIQKVRENSEKTSKDKEKTRELDIWKVKENIECNEQDTQGYGINLDSKRLIQIVKEFGEYPEKYRMFIWKHILKLPENRQAYSVLVEKGPHEAWKDLHVKCPLKSLKLQRALEKCVNALSHWTPLFAEIDYLPEFVFPFVKLYQNNPLLAFEVSATLLLNWAYLWFEFFPNPPINILALTENLLAHHDTSLLKHLLTYKITSQQYAWPLLKTVFSEVFDRENWLRIWDNIFSQPPGFILYIAISFLNSMRGAIMKCDSIEAIEILLNQKNTVPAIKIIKEAYRIKLATPSQICPVKNLTKFNALSSPTYPVFDKYPIFIVDYQKRERQRIRDEEMLYLQNRQSSMELEQLRQRRKAQLEAWASQQQQLIDAEEHRKGLLRLEDEKVNAQRKRIQALNRELKIKELHVLDDVRGKFMDHMLTQKANEVGKLEKELNTRILARDEETKTALAEMEVWQLDIESRKLALEQQLAYENESALNQFQFKANLESDKLDFQHNKVLKSALEVPRIFTENIHETDIAIANAEVKKAGNNLIAEADRLTNLDKVSEHAKQLEKQVIQNNLISEHVNDAQNILREKLLETAGNCDVLDTNFSLTRSKDLIDLSEASIFHEINKRRQNIVSGARSNTQKDMPKEH
ncbi:TBC1 domain family member 31-like [Oopsacas minuta]|uniref:TBC1 domain family member 31 n=1 Tax=Oopsacas minuta TaxID=111878 RepID=A0AAV7JQ17_9METZ|nr:TBC1 domain family member 31-like [Oopsacas minuta]